MIEFLHYVAFLQIANATFGKNISPLYIVVKVLNYTIMHIIIALLNYLIQSFF